MPTPSSRLIWAGVFLAFVMVIALMFGQMRQSQQRAARNLPSLGVVPEFTLVNQDGEAVTLETLKGKPWVANFIFTRCKGPCPLMTSRMSEVSRKLARAKDVRLVTITVDPEYDTPEVLREYARAVEADTAQWQFLTGDPKAVEELVVKGFFQPLAEDKDGSPVHSTRFVVVDAEGAIRSYQDGMDPEVVQKLLLDMGDLLREQNQKP